MGEVVNLKTKKVVESTENAEYWMERYYEEIAYKDRNADLEYRLSCAMAERDMYKLQLFDKPKTVWQRVWKHIVLGSPR